MPVQSATFTTSLFDEKPAVPLQPFDPPPGETTPPATKPEDAPPRVGLNLPAVFPVYAWI